MADLSEMRQSIEATKALLREQETALLEAEVSELEAEHNALMARCRTAKEEFDRLVQETDEMTGEVRKRDNEVKSAQWMLEQHRGNRVPRFASEKEIEDHRSALIEGNRALEEAEAKAGEIWPRYELLRMKRKQAHEAFTKLVDEEGMLSARLGHKRRELRSLKPQTAIDTSQFENVVFEYGSGGFTARPDDPSRQYVRNTTPLSTSVSKMVERYQSQLDPLRPI